MMGSLDFPEVLLEHDEVPIVFSLVPHYEFIKNIV